MISFDTNLLLYSLNQDCAEYNDARAFFASLPATPNTVAVCELVLIELYVLLRNPAVLANPLDPADAFVAQPFRAPARTEGVGKLRDGEDAFAAEFLALLRAHAGQQAQIVLVDGDLPTAGLEFALSAVAVQDEIRRRGAGEQRGDFLSAFPHFANEGGSLHLQDRWPQLES